MTTSPGSEQSGASAPLPHAGAVTAAANLQIASVRFLRLNALTEFTIFDSLPEDISPQIAFTRPTTRTEGDQIAFTLTFLFRIAADGQKAAFDLSATTEVVYLKRPNTDIQAEHVEEFAQVNVPFNAWPYWREVTQSFLSRLGLPTLPIPLFRIQDAKRLMVERVAED